MMKKKFLLILVLCLCLINCNVFADSKDIEAKYETTYNVDLVKVNLSDSSKNVSVGNYNFEISTSMDDIEIVIIKNSGNAQSYAKGFSGSDESFYFMISKNGKKVDSSNVDVKINTSSKVLNIYKNDGKLVSKSIDKINLVNNDYFLVVTDKLDINNDDYIITDNGKDVTNVDDIVLEEDNEVEVYDSKDNKIDSSSILGTNYKVVVTDGDETTTYVVIVKGDTTGDAKVNLNDITRLYHNYKGIEDMDNPYVLAGDVAKNDVINLNDVTKLYHYYKKLIPSL